MNQDFFYIINDLSGHNQVLDSFSVFLSDGFGFFLIAGLAAFLALHKDKKKGVRDIFVVLAAAVAAYILAKIIKTVFPHPRPFEVLPDVQLLVTKEGGDSFPSGHATFYMALASALFFYHRRLAYWYVGGALVVGLGRILVGVHWPFDVLAGFILGAFVGTASVYCFKKLYK